MYYIIAIYIVKFIHYETKSFKRRSSGLKVIKAEGAQAYTQTSAKSHVFQLQVGITFRHTIFFSL